MTLSSQNGGRKGLGLYIRPQTKRITECLLYSIILLSVFDCLATSACALLFRYLLHLFQSIYCTSKISVCPQSPHKSHKVWEALWTWLMLGVWCSTCTHTQRQLWSLWAGNTSAWFELCIALQAHTFAWCTGHDSRTCVSPPRTHVHSSMIPACVVKGKGPRWGQNVLMHVHPAAETVSALSTHSFVREHRSVMRKSYMISICDPCHPWSVCGIFPSHHVYTSTYVILPFRSEVYR